jgi:hypothetical protein
MLLESQELSKMPCILRPSASAVDSGHPVLMDATRLSNSLICQPQQRNTAGRVFGVSSWLCRHDVHDNTALLLAGVLDEASIRACVRHSLRVLWETAQVR